jgi:hypothetical protein
LAAYESQSPRRRPLQAQVSSVLQEKRALQRQKEEAAYNLLFQRYAQQPLPPGERGESGEARFTPSANLRLPAWQDQYLDDEVSSIGNSVTSYKPRITPKSETMTMMRLTTTRIPDPPPSKPNIPKSTVSQPNARRDAIPDILNTGTGNTDLMQTGNQDSGDNNHDKGNDTEPDGGRSPRRSRLCVAAACLMLVVFTASIVGLSLTLIWFRFDNNNNDSKKSTSVDSPRYFYPTSSPSSSPTDPPLVSVPVDLL